MSDQAITLSTSPDFTGLKLIQSPTGHVRTPWFTCEQEPGRPPFNYYRLREASQSAFARAIGINEWDMIFSEKQDPTDPQFKRWWCWGTKNPVQLPKKRPADPLAIDI